jgi:diacylglycerol kinase (ATP)
MSDGSVAMKINILINPKCCNADRVIGELHQRFPGDDISIYFTKRRSRIAEKTKAVLFDPADIFIAVGGDGTVNEAVNAIAGSETALGIIPCGSANDLATMYNLPHDTAAAFEIIKSENRVQLDLISINSRFYASAGGLGFSSGVVEMANRLKKIGLIKNIRSKIYILAVLLTLYNRKYRNHPVVIQRNGNQTVINAFAIFVNNQPYLGKNIRMTPGACNNDNMFDICIIRNPLTNFQVLSLLYRSTKAAHGNLPYVNIVRASSIKILSKSNLKYFGDGEILDEANFFDLKVVPRALNLIVPRSRGEN